MASTIDPTTGLPITNQPISTSALSTPQTPLTITPPADTTPILTSAMNTGGSYTQQAQESTLLDQQAAQAQQDRVAGAGTVADLTRMAGGRLQERANLAQTNGENDLLKQISGYNTQAQGLIREATAIPLQTGAAYQGSSGTQAGVASVNRDLLQRNALQSLTLAQSAAIAQGNYDVAKNLADQQVNAKYAQVDAEIAARKINEEALYKNVTDPAIKKALEARMALTKKEEQMQAEKKASDLAVSNMLIEASPVAPKDVLARATEVQKRGGSAIEVARALGEYGGDYYKTALLKEQIETQRSNRATDAAQRAKIYQDIADSKSKNIPTTGVGAVQTPADLQSAVSNLKLTEAQSKALAFGQRAINADKALRARLQTYDPTTIFSATGRLLETDNARAFERDMSDFITAVLRKESGATITEDEFARFIPIYSPQGIMTNKNDITQTNTKRDAAIDALISEAGPASNALASYKKMNTAGSNVQVPENKFKKSLGVSSTPIGGAEIVNKISDDGSYDFTLPTATKTP